MTQCHVLSPRVWIRLAPDLSTSLWPTEMFELRRTVRGAFQLKPSAMARIVAPNHPWITIPTPVPD